MSATRQVFANTMALGLSKVAERATTTLLGFFVARKLGAAPLGVYSAAMAYYGIVFLAAGMGCTNYVIREVAKKREHTSRYIVHLTIMVGIAAVAVMAASILIIPQVGYSHEMTSTIYLVLLAVVPAAISTILEAVFIAHQRVHFITFSSLVSAAANLAISLWLLRSGYGIVSLVAGFVVVQYVQTFCYAVFIRQAITRLTWEFDVRFARRLLADLRPFAASSALSGVLARPEVMILSFLHNEVQVGYYGAALKLVDMWVLIPQIYMTNVFPVMSRSYHLRDGRFNLIRDKSIKYLFAISLPLAAGIFIAAGPIVNTLYGSAFGPAVPVLRMLAPVIPLISLGAVVGRVLTARGEQGRVTGLQALTTAIRLPAGYALLSWLSALGGAICFSGMMLLHNCLLLFYAGRDGMRLPILQLSWRFGLAALWMAGAIYLLRGHLALWQLVPAATVIYVLLLVPLKAFSPDDLVILRRITEKRTAKGQVANSENIA